MANITGIVKKINVPVAGKTVRLYYRDTGELYGETTSAIDGTFTFSGVPVGELFTAIALSDDQYYNNAIDDGLMSEDACDPHYDLVTLHLQFTGANNASVFNYSGIYNITNTTVANAVTKTDNYKFDGSSAYFNQNSYIQPNTVRALQFDNNDFTIQTWLYISANLTSTYHVIISQRGSFSSEHNLTFLVNGLDSGGKLMLQWGGNNGSTPSTIVEDPATFPVGQWVHVAVTRTGNTVRLFKDGIIVDTETISGSFFHTTNVIQIGRIVSGYYLNGYMQDLQVTRGYSRYTANFTPPSEMLPTINCSCDPYYNDVVLYLKGDGIDGGSSITDSSPLNLVPTLVNSGITTVYSSNSFNTSGIKTLASSASIYFSKTNFADTNEDFTIEGWIQVLAGSIVEDGYSDGRGSFLRLLSGGASGTKIVEFAGMISFISNTHLISVPTAGAYALASGYDRFHFIVTRQNNNMTVWINGTIQSNYISGVSNNIDTIRIGDNPNSAGRYTSAILDEIRFTKGVARYVSNIIPLTAEYISVECT